jgi:hypothetical protein
MAGMIQIHSQCKGKESLARGSSREALGRVEKEAEL